MQSENRLGSGWVRNQRDTDDVVPTLDVSPRVLLLLRIIISLSTIVSFGFLIVVCINLILFLGGDREYFQPFFLVYMQIILHCALVTILHVICKSWVIHKYFRKYDFILVQAALICDIFIRYPPDSEYHTALSLVLIILIQTDFIESMNKLREDFVV